MIAFGFSLFVNSDWKNPVLTFKRKTLQIDLGITLFLIYAVICLLLTLEWAGSVLQWHDSRVWSCLLEFGCLIIAFTIIQILCRFHATLPPRIVSKQRKILARALFGSFRAITRYATYLPFYFQAVKGQALGVSAPEQCLIWSA